MDIRRDRYLNQLISYMWDGQVKVITGIRRCGKSYLLRVLFRKYLLEQGVEERQILSYELDLARDIQFRNPLLLSEAVRSVVEGSGERFYLFIDEIQMSDENVLLETSDANSPSTAGWIVLGHANNGWSVWKDSEGQPIDIYRK